MSWSEEQEDTTTYRVVMNHEEQYSIWPAEQDNPLGWQDAGKSGLKAECLAYIQEVWTDMRPLSLRRQMEEAARYPERYGVSPTPPAAPVHDALQPGTADDLVQRLCTGEHAVAAVLRPVESAQALKERIDAGYVSIKFVNTRGGTELGIRLDPSAVNLGQADFVQPRGMVHMEGELTLNYVKVRCIANIDLTTLTGQGHLEPVGA